MKQVEMRVRRAQRRVARWGAPRPGDARAALAVAGAVVVMLGALGLFAAQGAAAAPAPTGDDAAHVVLAAGPTGSGAEVTAPTASALGAVTDLVAATQAAHLTLAPVFGLLALAGATVVRRRTGPTYDVGRRRTTWSA